MPFQTSTSQSLKSAAGFLEGAGVEHGAAVILEVGLELLPREAGELAPVGAGHGGAGALGLVGRQRVGHVLEETVAARDEPLGALVGLVLGQLPPLELVPALVLAVDGLQWTAPGVALHVRAGEVLPAELAPRPPQRARVLEVVLHQHPRDLRPAEVRARRCVMLACLQVSLQSS